MSAPLLQADIKADVPETMLTYRKKMREGLKGARTIGMRRVRAGDGRVSK
jgi:hypothetical protein